MPQVFRLSSSFRVESLEVTLSRTRSVARQLGISRVTEITRLDCVGVPVFASIRPDALPGSLCVNAGKGLSTAEAQVGAYMEAIEYAFAEYHRSAIEVIPATPRDVYDGRRRPDAILDFCPVMGAEIALDGPIACVQASDICTGEQFLVPAELVFLPFPEEELGGNCYFGSSSNGLCSGNSVLEATVHGLAEVIERDICSFQSVNDQSLLVANGTLPAPIRDIVRTLTSTGMNLYVRHLENMFEIPYFMAVVAEAQSIDPIYVSVGYGCHPLREIAVTRAVCEALQSRLSFIHGGRDDLTKRYQRFEGWSGQERKAYARSLLSEVSKNGASIQFGQVRDYADVATDLETSLELLMATLAKNGFRRILRVVYTAPEFPLQVVRLLVPGLECFNETTVRIGLRLRDYVRDQL